MHFSFSETEERFRHDMRNFLQASLPPDWDGPVLSSEERNMDVILDLRKKLAKKGWLTIGWAKEYGGLGESPIMQTIYLEELAYHRASVRDIGVELLGPTLALHGTEEQKRTFLPPLSRGEMVWCQGYSEPGTGSDLASLTTRAVEDGDDFIVTGRKVWISNAHLSNWMFLLARTGEANSRHNGLSFLLLDMKSPAVTVRPIHDMIGGHHFNEVTLDDVRIPKRWLVGEKNRGWAVSVTLLTFERQRIDYSARGRRTLEELVAYVRDMSALSRGSASAGLIRQSLADLAIRVNMNRLMAYRVAQAFAKGELPTTQASITKVSGAELLQAMARVGMQLLGLYGQVETESKHAKLAGRLLRMYALSLSTSIAGGTNEIQRNLIATRGLGLPR